MHVTIWEFRVKKGLEAEFERSYGPTGEWARFFERGEGYLGTELLRDTKNRQRYITIDRWISQATHEAFRSRWAEEYEAIDERCEALTEYEVPLGSLAPPVGEP
jgi:heme-degrading monooxygenase HmoA